MTRLDHQAFIYQSPEQFAGAMAPVLTEALERGDAVFAAAKRSSLDALREELGDAAAAVRLEDAGEWETQPFSRLQAFRRMVADLRPDQSLSALGEPAWSGPESVIRQWARYESVINLALADAPMRFICLYDGASLPGHILDYAARTHPTRVSDDGTAVMPCHGFTAPARFAPGEAVQPPAHAIELPLDGVALRRAVAEHADTAGLSADRVDGVVLAIHETVTNAFRHGVPPARAWLWTTSDEIVCQVADSGPGFGDPLAGWLPPAPDARSGWGLPIVRQLCDAVDFAPSGRATVSLHFARRR